MQRKLIRDYLPNFNGGKFCRLYRESTRFPDQLRKTCCRGQRGFSSLP